MLPAETQLWGPFQLQRCRHRQPPAPMCLEGEQKGQGQRSLPQGEGKGTGIHAHALLFSYSDCWKDHIPK